MEQRFIRNVRRDSVGVYDALLGEQKRGEVLQSRPPPRRLVQCVWGERLGQMIDSKKHVVSIAEASTWVRPSQNHASEECAHRPCESDDIPAPQLEAP